MDPKKVYQQLYKEFGPQGWWPVGGKLVIPANAGIQSRSSGSPVKPGMTKAVRFEIMLGAILTQNTAWGNVEKALANLRLAQALRPEAIVRMSTQRLERLIRPAGYFRQKAKKVKIFSRWAQKNKFDKTTRSSKFVKSTETLRNELLGLWGIGPETADSILLYALNRPVFVVDAYTKRLCAVHGVQFKTYNECRRYFEERLRSKSYVQRTRLYNEMHALIVAWGKLYHQDKKSALRIIRTRERGDPSDATDVRARREPH